MAIGDVEVINTLGPKNDGPFPIARALEILGGYKTVADATARDAIPASRREQGTLVRTNDDGKMWVLDAGLVTWTEFVGGGGGGGGAYVFVKTYAELAALAPTDPAEIKHVMVGDATGDPDPFTPIDGLPVAYVWHENVYGPTWLRGSLIGGTFITRDNTNGTAVTSMDGAPIAFPGVNIFGSIYADVLGGTLDWVGPVSLGSVGPGGQVNFRSPNGEVLLPLDDATSGKISTLAGGPYASLSAAIKKALVSNAKVVGARFIGGVSPQTIFVNPTAGNDTTGDGLTSGTAYASIQRAVNDVPDGFTVDVIIKIAAGSFNAVQNVAINVMPGWFGTATQARMYIMGDDTTPDITFAATQAYLTPTNLVSGKRAQFTKAIPAYGATITDGSHWLSYTVGGRLTSKIALASTTPNLVVVLSANTTFPIGTKVIPYATTFTGSFSIGAPMGPSGPPFVHLYGLKITGSISITGCVFDGSHVAPVGNGITQDCNFLSGYFVASGSNNLLLNDAGQGRSMANTFFSGHVSVRGARGSCQGNVFRGNNTGTMATLSIASSVTTFGAQRNGHRAGFTLFTNCDFEITTGALDHIWLFNGAIMGDTNSLGAVSFSGGGAAFKAEAQSLLDLRPINGTTIWSGSVGAPSQLLSGSILLNTRSGVGQGFQADNTATPGDDLRVGAGGPAIDRATAFNIANLGDLALVN